MNDTLRIVAWPLVVAAIFFVTRKPLVGLLQRVTGMRYDKFELELQAKTIEASTEVSMIDTERRLPSTLEWDERRNAIAGSPARTVVATWQELEGTIERFFKARAHGPWPGTVKAVSELRVAGVLTSDEASVFSKLYELKNLLIYEIDSVSNPSAYVLEFLRMTSILKSRLQERAPAPR